VIIENPKLLAEYRTPGRCEICGEHFSRRVPHHVRAKGRGFTADIRINLISVGPEFGCVCHEDAQRYRLSRCDVEAIVAVREGTMQHHIRAVMDLLERMDKSGRRTMKGRPVADELADLDGGARDLARRVLREAGVSLEEAA
jgi:hypothetical protein